MMPVTRGARSIGHRFTAACSFVLLLGVRPEAAGGQADGLHIRTGTQESLVPWVTSQGARFLPLASLARALGGSVTNAANGATLDACGMLARFVVGQRTVAIGESGLETMRLAVIRGGISGTLVPLEFVTDVLPRYGTGIVWDPDERELRRFSTYARRTGATSALPPAQLPTPDPEVNAPRTSPASAATTANGNGALLRPDPDARPVSIGGSAPRTGTSSAPPSRPSAPPAANSAARRKVRSVVIDAGHGGPDNGMTGVTTTGNRVYEKDITLAVSLKVAEALRARGVTVYLTRTRDTLIALSDRGRIANQQRADLFISIHVNAANPRWRDASSSRGFETYFLAEAKTEDESRVERMENEAIKFETGANAPRGDPLSFIINDMAQNEHLRESSDLAGEVQRRIRESHPGTDRGVKQANFAVLRGSFMPAVLVELGFGTNRQEASFLSASARQTELARSIADATVEYLNRYERRVGGGTR